MSLSVILTKRTSIYDRSKRRFDLNKRSRDLTVNVVQTIRFVSWFNTHNHRSLYNCHEPNAIDVMATLDRRSSIYQRACITDQISSLASDLGKYYKF